MFSGYTFSPRMCEEKRANWFHNLKFLPSFFIIEGVSMRLAGGFWGS